MKKVILIIVIIFCLSGCTAEMNLNLEDFLVIENASIDFKNDNIQYDDKLIYYVNDRMHEVEHQTEILGLFDYESKDNFIKFDNMTVDNNLTNEKIFKTCYDDVIVNKTSKMYSIKTIGRNTCFDKYPDLEKIIINVNSSKKVLSSTSDRSILNTHTWIITKDSIDKEISISYNIKSFVLFSMNNIVYLIIGLVLTILLMIFSLILIKSKKNNAI